MDKAGAYGIQDWIGIIATEKIKGNYTNIVGFPVSKPPLKVVGKSSGL